MVTSRSVKVPPPLLHPIAHLEPERHVVLPPPQRAIKDEKDGEILPIVFYGVRPDNFQQAASAIIEGQLQADGTFEANNLLLKCPSRYEEEPSEVYVESVRK